MKLVVQRVSRASVFVGDKSVGKIGKGLFVLVGVRRGDNKEDVKNLAEKLSKLRIMADGLDKMNLSVKDVSGKMLVVSQFTLYSNTLKGNRPSFIEAAEPAKAVELYDYFVKKLTEREVEVETGVFGANMIIETDLDGPVTIIMEK
jgi:D-tyrosyl-tRNA(Tyr) deacylase